MVTTQSGPQKLNKETIYRLIEQFQHNPEEEVQTTLVKHYEDLVHSLAHKYSKGKGFHDDLVQVGMIGLLAACRRYDADFGKSFESFAIPTIIGEMKRFIRDKTWSVHVPRRIKELGPKIKSAAEHLTTKLERSPMVDEIAVFLDVSEEEILEAMEIGQSYQALSVDRNIESDSEGSTVTLLDMVGDKEGGYEHVDHQLMLNKAFEVLSEREQAILKYTYFENLSQKETGEMLGISQMHVSRLQRKALKKLREAFQTNSEERLN